MGKNVLEIICGTYEEFLLGYIFNSKVAEITQTFAAHDHTGSIRSVAHSEHYLASGSTDDRVIIYDLKTRKEHCMLTHHNATINCIQFTENHSHIITGCADGVLAIVRTGNWQLEKVWDKAHKGAAVLDLAIHPSGKLALTLGADGTLCTWNLIKGRQAFKVNLNSKCRNAKSLEKIIWGPDSVRFILYGGRYTEVWSIDTGGPLKQIEHSEKVVSCVWLNEESLLVGYENGQLCKLEIETAARTVKNAHKSRVKALAIQKRWIVSGCSDGELKVWDEDLNELCRHDVGCRITCLCIVPQVHIKKENVDLDDKVSDVVKIPTSTLNKSTGGVVIIEEEEDEEIQKHVTKKKGKKKQRKECEDNKPIDSPPENSEEPKRKKKRRKVKM